MIKLVQCVRKQPEIELLEFRNYWDEYRRMMENAREVLGISRVLFSTALAFEESFEVMLTRGTQVPYDGMVELFFENATIFREVLAHPDTEALLEEIRAFQGEFMDLDASAFFFAINDGY